MSYIEMKHSYRGIILEKQEIVANRDVNFEIERENWSLSLVHLEQGSQPF